ncbi:MAG TPA: hypothetical protein VES88_10060 [Gemmatimonadaceae bacterium]|nr:hypothetical protein [Gemmatimonadaceae bacterium]
MTVREAPWYPSLSRYIVRDDFAVELSRPFTDASGERISSVPSVFVQFPMWRGEPFVDDFGKKSAAMVELRGEHLFAELAILRLLEERGWEGRWVNTYSGRGEVWKYLTEWRDVPRRDQVTRPILDQKAAALLERIASTSGSRFAGCWDVFAWRGVECVFLEAKRQSPKYKDRVKDDQEGWLRAALSLSNTALSRASFSFVQWDY